MTDMDLRLTTFMNSYAEVDVPSHTIPDAWWTVRINGQMNSTTCTCPGAYFAREPHCRHITEVVAVMLDQERMTALIENFLNTQVRS